MENDDEKENDREKDDDKENKQNQRKKKRTNLELKDISYNNNPVIRFPENEFQVKFEQDKKTNNIKEFKQEIDIEKQIEINLSYNSKRNKTSMEIKTSTNKKQKIDKDGLVILQLTTNKGVLETTY